MRVLFTLVCLLLPFCASFGQDEELTSLLLAGFPIIDQDQKLERNDRAQISAAQQDLKDCCDIQAIILVQEQSLTGNPAQDVQTLRTQMDRTNLLTDQTIVLLFQSNPQQVVVSRPLGLRQETAALTKAETDRLSALIDTRDLPAGITATLNQIEASYRTQRLPTEQSAPTLSLPIWVQETLLHAAAFIFAALLALLFLKFRKPAPDILRPTPDFILPKVQAIPSFMNNATFNGSVNLMIVRQHAPLRHRGFLFTLAFLISGLCFVLVEGARLTTLEPWYLRAGLTIATLGILLILLMLTRLGSWLTLARTRRKLLHHQLTLLANKTVLPNLIFLHQVHRGRIEVWLTQNMPITAELLRQQLARLQADANHGLFDDGLKKFLSQFDRLARTYAQGELAGQVIRERL